MNHVILTGRLASDPARRDTNTSVVCTFRLAVGRAGQNGGRVWIEVDTWGHLAGTCHQHLRKGRQVLIAGRLNQTDWVDRQSGEKRTRYYVTADSIEFLDRPADLADGDNR